VEAYLGSLKPLGAGPFWASLNIPPEWWLRWAPIQPSGSLVYRLKRLGLCAVGDLEITPVIAC